MSEKIKEILTGIAYGVLTMLFIIGMLPWDFVSKIIACIIAMAAIYRIRKILRQEKSASPFAVSYMAVIIACTLIINSLSA